MSEPTCVLERLAKGSWEPVGAGRAVQDDGLDVERLRKCPTLMVLLSRYGTFNDAWWDRLADEYRRAAPPLHDPEEPK